MAASLADIGTASGTWHVARTGRLGGGVYPHPHRDGGAADAPGIRGRYPPTQTLRGPGSGKWSVPPEIQGAGGLASGRDWQHLTDWSQRRLLQQQGRLQRLPLGRPPVKGQLPGAPGGLPPTRPVGPEREGAGTSHPAPGPQGGRSEARAPWGTWTDLHTAASGDPTCSGRPPPSLISPLPSSVPHASQKAALRGPWENPSKWPGQPPSAWRPQHSRGLL